MRKHKLSALSTIAGAILVSLPAGSAPAYAQANTEAPHAMTVEDLKDICTGNNTSSLCSIYILGISQGMDIGMHIERKETAITGYCAPDNITSEKLALIVKLRIGEDLMFNPEDAKIDASGFVAAALALAFPCNHK